MPVRTQFILLSIIIPIATLILAMVWPNAYGLFIVILALIILGLYDMLQRKHAILRL
ncbi:MAG: hypothetical protein OQK98_01905 [Gammaproteobacteria bacterium]|nr:hypothetical protein [Gammaproteobacteria bacterium]